MKHISRRTTLLGGAVALAGCTQQGPRFLSYSGPAVTGIVAYKERRVLHLFHGETVLATYAFELGTEPVGHKQVEGDGKTPEGQYWIDRRNPQSEYHLSLGISYPNERDKAVAASMGMPPGGDIFIHGTPQTNLAEKDWTVGCLAVKNLEIEVMYSMVRNGTPIWIQT